MTRQILMSLKWMSPGLIQIQNMKMVGCMFGLIVIMILMIDSV